MTNKEAETPMPKKIAFIGTSCIGKTTIIEYLKTQFSNDSSTVFVDEAARIFFATYIGSDRFSVEIQSKIQDLALIKEKAAHSQNPKIIFCDRSVIDAVVYTSARGNKKGALELLERVKEWLPTYYKLVLLDPVDIPYKQDEIRQEDEETRQKFHEEFINFLSEVGIKYELLSGDIGNRLRKILELSQINQEFNIG